jgi:hypothetical protein
MWSELFWEVLFQIFFYVHDLAREKLTRETDRLGKEAKKSRQDYLNGAVK